MTKNQWDLHDRLRLTRDCELGKLGEVLFVLSVDGPYMSARVDGTPPRHVRTGRDYEHAVKIGEGVPPGAYRLDGNVENPRPDRRHARDWRKFPLWTKGTQFVVKEQRRMGDRHLAEVAAGLDAEVTARLRADDRYTVIELAGDRWPTNHRIGPGDEEQYAALAIALVPNEETLDQFMTRIDCQNGFVEWLVENGAIARPDLEKWWHRYQYGDDDAVEPPIVVTLPVDPRRPAVNFKSTVVNAYQTNKAGALVLHLEDDQGECAELVITPSDVPRMMTAGIDALQRKASTR